MTAVGWDEDDDCTGHCCRTVAVLAPALPLRTRVRLAFERRIDRAGAWLCGHQCTRIAEALWRACRML